MCFSFFSNYTLRVVMSRATGTSSADAKVYEPVTIWWMSCRRFSSNLLIIMGAILVVLRSLLKDLSCRFLLIFFVLGASASSYAATTPFNFCSLRFYLFYFMKFFLYFFNVGFEWLWLLWNGKGFWISRFDWVRLYLHYKDFLRSLRSCLSA